MNTWKSKNRHKYLLQYHLILVCKYRKKLLNEPIRTDNGFGMFRTILKQKTEEIGKKLIKIPRFYASSKTCSVCNVINKGLTLDDRTWTCTCGTIHDRDTNTAIYIRNYGMTLIQQTAGTAGIAC
ncbi:MAG: zinc ribbon domain-containing protein [Methanolobus sp.]|nr:zinc ribbon domain-containing protein [Methanolobus sp.]